MKVSIAFYYINIIYTIVIDSEADTESNTESDAESLPSIQSSPISPPTESPPAEFSDWDGFSDTLSFNSASDAFTDNHTDSEPEGIDTSWLYTTVEELAGYIRQLRAG